MQQQVLFIGGTGNISWYCVKKCVDLGMDVSVLNRHQTVKTRRALPAGVKLIEANVYDEAECQAAVAGKSFDCVCDFICFNGEQARTAYNVFNGKARQFIVISTEGIFKRNDECVPYSEDAPLVPQGERDGYTAGKIEVEEFFQRAYFDSAFPVTIARPGYTYDTILPCSVGHNCFTAARMIMDGYPAVVAGDGENKWTYTHSSDFAELFCALVGAERAIGQSYNVMSDEVLTVNEATRTLLRALGADENRILHVKAEDVEDLRPVAIRDNIKRKMENKVFNTSKVRDLAAGVKTRVHFEDGVRRTVEWFKEDAVRQRFSEDVCRMISGVCEKYGYDVGGRK